MNRKVWGGNRTRAGADTYGVIVSVLATAAKHGVDGLDYLAARARGPDPGSPPSSAERRTANPTSTATSPDPLRAARGPENPKRPELLQRAPEPAIQ